MREIPTQLSHMHPTRSQPRHLLDLNGDVLTAILEYVSAKDSRSFMLCSKRANEVALPRAYSSLTLLMSPRSFRRYKAIYSRAEHKLAWLREVTILHSSWSVFDFASVSSLAHDRKDGAAMLYDIVSHAHGLRKLVCYDIDQFLRIEPRLSHEIRSLQSLSSLKLLESTAFASGWYFDRPDPSTSVYLPSTTTDPPFRHLSCLTVKLLNFLPTVGVSELTSLKRLEVEVVLGDITHLIKLAPQLESLTVVSVIPSVTTAPASGWTTLNYLEGPAEQIHALLPLIHAPVPHIAINVARLSPRMTAKIVEQLSPCRISVRTDMSPPEWFYEELHHAPPCLFYIEFEAPIDYNRWVSSVPPLLKGFNSLLCLDVDLQRYCTQNVADVKFDNELRLAHYVTWKVPSLRFLLLRYAGLPKDVACPEAYGYRLPRGTPTNYAEWLRGKTLQSLSRDTAQQIRSMFYEAVTHEAASRVEGETPAAL
ncbi:hypothetical protein NM688_g7602 [Phlebia brevispora]|uniref:Uncharacterized protein n=1 Tax=Phlebia brevispora TaxID=194682 RepID=A0ACC1S3I1_9APHY|nr:hypothetical protein NM688_g7602 [Phlebia brevispora]